MSEKVYVQAQDLLDDAVRLGVMVVNSGFKPRFIVGIWRGGTPIGIAVQEVLAWAGIQTDHIAIRTSSYGHAIDQRGQHVRVHGLNYLVDHVNAEDSMLFVDDVFDTGHTIEAVVNKLRRKARLNTPRDIRVAVPWYKPMRNQTDRVPEYYLHETDQWIKFPHSLEGLSDQEIKKYRPEIWSVLKE
ncbi:MAG: phosphoribosyltransferase family protein [Acidiferrobacterales bacterium]|nr:phosphoribosyltransferase family protein [Acidiferrobacterales bacterium]